MIGLFDRDVFYKLCCCDLWHEAVAALGITEPYRLAATSSEKSNRKVLSQMLKGLDPELVIKRTQDIIELVPVLSDDLVEAIYSSDHFQTLSNIENIDGGEQVLAAILMENPDGQMLLSGDKRFVNALKENLPDEWKKIEHSVISFELCLLAIEKMFGFDYLIERIFGAQQCDGSLRIAVGQNPNRENFCAALESFDPCRVVLNVVP